MATIDRIRAWARELRAISAEIDRARLAHRGAHHAAMPAQLGRARTTA
jgi:hypothetical protein